MGDESNRGSKTAIYCVALASTLALVSSHAIAQQVADKKIRVVAGQKLTFIKIVNKQGEARSEVLDAKGRRLAARQVPRAKPQTYRIAGLVSLWPR